MRIRLGALSLALAVAAAPACYIDTGSSIVAVQPMELDTAEWNLGKADFGIISSAVDLDDQLIVFSNKGMFVLSGGVISAQDNTVTAWVPGAAAAVPASDGNGTWAVAVDGTGTLQRVYAASKLDAVSDRYGLKGAKVLGLARASSPDAPGAIAFALDGVNVAFTDGKDVQRYDVVLSQVSAAPWRIGGVAPDGSVVTVKLDPAKPTHDGTAFKIVLDDVLATAFDGDRLVIEAKRALYRERIDGTFDVVMDAGDDLHGLAATPNGIWFGVGARLCLYDGELHCADASLDPVATLVGSGRGVYAIEQGKMRALERKAGGAEGFWRAQVRPVFARVCSSCHARGGSSGIDLSSYKAWASHLAPVEDRVLVKKNMPTNQTLSGTDYQTVRTWVDCQKDASKCPPP